MNSLKMLIHIFIMSWVEYCNVVLAGSPFDGASLPTNHIWSMGLLCWGPMTWHTARRCPRPAAQCRWLLANVRMLRAALFTWY